MTTLTLTGEFDATSRRFRRTLATSVFIHAVLFLILILRGTAPAPRFVEVSWLQDEPLPPPAPALPVQARPEPEKKTEPRPVKQSPVEEKFERSRVEAPVRPDPQLTTATRDRVKERLAALTPSTLQMGALTATRVSTSSLLKSAPVKAPDKGLQASTIDLKREETERPRPRTLRRESVQTERDTPALAEIAPRDLAGTEARLSDVATSARRTLAGAELGGQIADRPVLKYQLPVYPEWAKTQAVEATVTLYFVVLPSGELKENIQVRKTAGFADFDEAAIRALAEWRFEALSGGFREQWGTITFRFRLRG